MKYNLLDNGYITSSGTITLTVEEMVNLLVVSGTVTISGSGNDNVWIDCDLVDRIGIDETRYYFDSSTSSGTVASGISFYYKNDEADSYSSLTTNIGSSYYYATITSPSAPRYIKLNHDVSGTSISGTMVGFEVLNNDEVIDFGSDGTLTSTYVLTSLNYLNYQDYIKEIEVYNSGDTIATAHVMFDPQYSDSDELLSISASENGPWVYARKDSFIVIDGSLWDNGQYDDTNTDVGGKLRLDGGYTVGTYTTPIFKNESVRFAYLDVLQTSVSGALVATDAGDYTSTLQIRSSNDKPWDYNVYRKVFTSGTDIYYKDFLLDTDTEVYNSFTETGQYFGSFITTLHANLCHISAYSGKSCFIYSYTWKCGSYSYCSKIVISLATLDGRPLADREIYYRGVYDQGVTPTYPELVVHFIEVDYNDGVWVYLAPGKSGSYDGYDMLELGYYLLHYNSSMGRTFKEYVSSDFIIGCDVVKDDSGSLWYSRISGTPAIFKISSTGTTLLIYDSVTTSLGRLCSTYDGGCWFIDDGALYKLDSDGVLEDSITNLEINNELTWVARDENDSGFLWIVDGVYVKLISMDCRVHKSVYLEGFTIVRMYSTTEGLVVFCTQVSSGNEYLKFIGRESVGVDKTILNDGLVDGDYRGIQDVSYDNPVLGDIIPLADDPTWNSSLEWNKAVTDNCVLPREEYNQLKLTLRRPNVSIDSPTITNIYYQDNVELEDIYPGQSKTLYLKISIPDGMSVSGDYSSMLRVWWELLAS
jgi:hypothetical protein